MNTLLNFIKIIFFSFYILKINCRTKECYEYSCAECETSEYGTCINCREGFSLIDGTCPCSFSSCALCTTGLAGLNICEQCKDGYSNVDKNCVCSVNNCEQCSADGCAKCNTGYHYDETLKNCIKDDPENAIKCFDPGCDSCISEEQGACESCKEGYYLKKGECLNLTKTVNGNCPDDNDYYISNNYCYPSCEGLKCNIFVGFRFPYFVLQCRENKCLVCIGNDILIVSECDNSEECSEIEGCLNCLTNEECLICQQGYYSNKGKCKKCSEGCSICTSEQNCQVCMSGYELTSNKTCNLTYNFDYDTDLYQSNKMNLIKIYYPEEIAKPQTSIPIIESTSLSTETKSNTHSDSAIETSNIATEIIKEITDIKTSDIAPEIVKENTDIKTSDIATDTVQENIDTTIKEKVNIKPEENNFIKYYDSLGKYIIEYDQKDALKGEKCNAICSDINCLKCEIKDGSESCKLCPEEYQINKEKCESICSEDKCLSYSFKDNNLICIDCITGYYLEDNNCKRRCLDDDCETCSDDGNQCTQCQSDTKLYEGKCAKNKIYCRDYPNCNYCLEEEGCIECEENYEIKDKNCVQKKSTFWYIIVVIFILLLIIGIVLCILDKIKKNENMRIIPFMNSNDQQNDLQINNYQIRNIRNDLILSNSTRSVLSRDEIAEEYEEQKRKNSKARMTCMFCKKKPGNYKCDCGCIVCKEHSELEFMENNEEKSKVCYNCGKIVVKVTPIKYFCNICMQNKMSVTHFKCGCAMEVCKNCYIKCKMTNNKCPGCRAII